jgi:succinate dehydrogenase / fumarate reductase cytochrome b subunit
VSQSRASASPAAESQTGFVLARLHSLFGIAPVGLFLCFHLTVNATMLAGPEKYQRAVEAIHQLDGLGVLLPLEVLLIFAPLLFHALYGVVILFKGSVNLPSYRYLGNARYVLQRASGIGLLLFILFHIWQMHWLGKPFGGALFVRSDPADPLMAAGSVASAIRSSPLSLAMYSLGPAAAVFHLANGLWTAAITWGLTIGPRSQRLSGAACLALCAVVGAMAMATIHAFGVFRYPWPADDPRAARTAAEMPQHAGPAGPADQEKGP